MLRTTLACLLATLSPVVAEESFVTATDWKPVHTILLHPDGAGLAHWNALRVLEVGPDGMLAWDQLPVLSVYRVHQKNWLSSTSHAGATAHAFGRKVHPDSFGTDFGAPIRSLSGSEKPLVTEAVEAGFPGGIVNSGHLAEPGTAVFLTSAPARKDTDAIIAGLVASGAQVILGGGEDLFLPEGEAGFHGGTGVRRDDRNLIQEARDAGYTVVFTRDQLLALPDETEKVLGIFAARHTFNDLPEDDLAEAGLPLFDEEAPTVAEMTGVALRLLEHQSTVLGKPFVLVVEEEGTDNFSNVNNAAGMLEAMKRADDTIATVSLWQTTTPDSFLILAADSDAGSPTVWAPFGDVEVLPATDPNGAPIDGIGGSGTAPFRSAPDDGGDTYPFGIAWAVKGDVPGAILVRADGVNSGNVPANVQNTDIYRILYASLYGKLPSDEDSGGE